MDQRSAEAAISALGQLKVWPVIRPKSVLSRYLDWIRLCKDHLILKELKLGVGLLLAREISPTEIPQFPLSVKDHVIVNAEIRSLWINRMVSPISDPLWISPPLRSTSGGQGEGLLQHVVPFGAHSSPSLQNGDNL
jgi:hypothetical protein